MSKILGPILGPHVANVARHPFGFVMRTIKAFRANQGMLLAGAVAYYALLSIVPLLILIVIVLSKFIGQKELLDTLSHLLEWLVPGQARAVVRELANFLTHRAVIGWLLLITMIFFSSLAFTVLENAMSVIFVHRVAIRRRHFLLSALLPYCYILFLGVGMLIVTFVSNGLQAMGTNSLYFLGIEISLKGVSRLLLYLLGFAGEVFVLTSIYLVMPVGRPSLRLALIGSVTAAILWEITRHVLVWYFATLSQVSVVYGSLTTSIVVLFSLEALATLLLFGAQVISEFERFGLPQATEPQRFHTGTG
ncbi:MULTISPECIES: YihY/virulence factor BrkB family protein [unclassified Caballeronia]|uniref:YihY/virulence factor BrkB family protein n=1 Tax=unclassified Caballeronia TaxID=2646786 RepID=UPI002856AC93|nr:MULTISPECIES: YihY/virulence factor BrkB family protein [unclassified Caballeronia]MDR5771539.1 YihY/virulence factor BrkB family protein [Caballeronia sp. LZ002]MDR5846975.1 YihY/virulence factor BrkB family protein [Caballeronia sp. LZ003]